MAGSSCGASMKTGIPDYRGTAGNRGVHVLRRQAGGYADFLLVTFGESIDAIRWFAGDDIDTARYYPEDRAFLVELEPNVAHYDVLL